MSTALSAAVRARLTGTEALTGDGLAAQTALAALLATDPTSSPPGLPAVVLGVLRAQAVFPCVTFRPGGGGRSRLVAGPIMEPIYDFEFWTRSRSGSLVTDIATLVSNLLDYNRGVAPVLPLGSGRCFWMEALTEVAVLWDTQYDAPFGVQRYRFVAG